MLAHKTVAMLVLGAIVGVATFAGVAAGSMLGGLGMSVGNIAAISVLVTLLGYAFGALALALSAATGRVRVATLGTIGPALAFYVANALLPLNDRLAGWARWSPFYYYQSSDPLVTGMHWGHAGVLAALIVALVAAAIVLFRRRDLRQNG